MPYSKKLYYSNLDYREQLLSYHREWNRRHNYWSKENRPPRNMEKEKFKQRETEEKQKEECNRIFGNKCLFCGSSKGRLYLHEINGKNHKSRHPSHYLKRKETFRKLCGRCHIMVHSLMKLGKSWSEIEGFILKKGKEEKLMLSSGALEHRIARSKGLSTLVEKIELSLLL